MSTSCVKTTVVNTSGETRRFEFLPPYGIELTDGQTYTNIGSVYDWLKRGTRGLQYETLLRDLEYALDQGWLAIQSSPPTFMYDETLQQTRVLGIDNNIVSSQTPCYVEDFESTDLVND